MSIYYLATVSVVIFTSRTLRYVEKVRKFIIYVRNFWYTFDMRNSKELIDLADFSGQNKANFKLPKLLVLSILAGMYIAFGAIFFSIVTSYGGHAGAIKLMGGLVFCTGLVLVVLGGAELFTGNNLMVVSFLNKKIKLSGLLRNWGIVYIGNFIGALIMVLLMFATKIYLQGDSEIGLRVLDIANGKVNLDFGSAFSRAILCNMLVCLGIWLTMVAKTIPGKVLGIMFPITAFVSIGFEHCIANMYFIPAGMIIKYLAPMGFWDNPSLTISAYQNLTAPNFLFGNLVAVTLGNIIGGAFFVGALNWFVHKDENRKL